MNSTQDASTSWMLRYDHWDPSEQPLREALCTLGNGYFATRGAAEDASAGGAHYPGVYLAGGYNRLESEVADRVIENEDLVNWPNWLCLSFRIATEERGTDGEDEGWFHIDAVEVMEFEQTLDLHAGVLERRLRFRHSEERVTSLVSRRFVHMKQPHLAAIQWVLTPENWSGTVEIRSALDGSVTNQGVARYRQLSSRHLEAVDTGAFGENVIYLSVQTNQSHIRMAQAARTDVCYENGPAAARRETKVDDLVAEQRIFCEVQRKKPLHVEKIVALHTSRDFAVSEPLLAAREAAPRAGSFDDLLKTHRQAWSHLWRRADIEIVDTDDWSQKVLRLHIFHLLQTASANSIDLDIGVPARGLHGEAYRGHIFWDELFIFPFLNLRIPELTRSLLMYRHRRLPQARCLAKKQGYEGAMFPWQSGSTGREESQTLHLNPRSGHWIPDNTHRQRHVNAAIAYNVWQYFQATDDMEFLSYYGAEVLLDIARFWASLVKYDSQRDRYEIHDVVGPDEFHTAYPVGHELFDEGNLGLRNNAYTNFMAAWTIRYARAALNCLAEDRTAELMEDLQIDEEDFQRWDEISRKMFIPFHNEGVISQFEGYEHLEELPWNYYREKYGDIHRLDRVLEAEGDTPNRYQVSKQADVLMLFYLFSSEELYEMFQWLDYPFKPEWIVKNVDYYITRTSHGSTLSRVVHSWILARSDRERAWELFRQALRSDVADIQGGTTSEGIHLGAMAGTVDVIQRCHTGIEMRDEVLWLNPRLPDALKEIYLRVRYRGHWVRLRVSQERVVVSVEHGWSESVKIGFCGEVHTFSEGDEKIFECH